jgi:hypothetical protein
VEEDCCRGEVMRKEGEMTADRRGENNCEQKRRGEEQEEVEEGRRKGKKGRRRKWEKVKE